MAERPQEPEHTTAPGICPLLGVFNVLKRNGPIESASRYLTSFTRIHITQMPEQVICTFNAPTSACCRVKGCIHYCKPCPPLNPRLSWEKLCSDGWVSLIEELPYMVGVQFSLHDRFGYIPIITHKVVHRVVFLYSTSLGSG